MSIDTDSERDYGLNRRHMDSVHILGQGLGSEEHEDDGGGQHPYLIGCRYLSFSVDDHRIGYLEIQSLDEFFHSPWTE